MKEIIFERLDIIVNNRDILNYFLQNYVNDDMLDLYDLTKGTVTMNELFLFDVSDILKSFFCFMFFVPPEHVELREDLFNVDDFPKRIRTLVHFRVGDWPSEEFNRYKIVHSNAYNQLQEIYKNPVYINPDYCQY